MKRIISALLCLLLLVGCAEPGATAPNTQSPSQSSSSSSSQSLVQSPPLTPVQTTSGIFDALSQRAGYWLRAAVLHCGEGNGRWRDTLDALLQPLVLNLEAGELDTSATPDLSAALSKLDMLYLDESLLNASDWESIQAALLDFTQSGGAVLVPNRFADALPLDYLGASSFEALGAYPTDLSLPQGLGDLTALQSVISDFHYLYRSFSDFEALKTRDYGVAMVPDTAAGLAYQGDRALYAVNRYGKGAVLFVNPLLPNAFLQSGFSMKARDKEQLAFASTVASCNQLLWNEWAAYVYKLRYGFSLERVFGSYGSPSMSWELHYEEITGFEHNSLAQFSTLAEAARQIPSFSLVRNTYWWFTRVERMTYLLGQGRASPSFPMDYEENAYSSGTHIDSGGKWLSQGWLENGGSYFKDYPEYSLRLYPTAVDYSGDGREDFFCGTREGYLYYYENLGMTGLDGRLRLSEAQEVTDLEGKPLKMEYFSSPALLDLDGDGFLDLITGGFDGALHWFRGNGTLAFSPQGILLETDFTGQLLPSVGDIDGDGVLDLAVGSFKGILLLYFGQKQDTATVFDSGHMAALSRLCADQSFGSWLSPCLADYNGDGALDLLIGTLNGYIAFLPGDGHGGFTFSHYLSCGERDYKGTDRIKFGTYATPLLLDLNDDGILDLLCGYQEYGLAYPIDSPYFPQRDTLQQQMDWAKDRHYYVGLHFYTNSYASPEREAYELEAHKRAMEAYGLETNRIGANQHTWYISTLAPEQSMESLWNAGLLWQSGYAGAGSTYIAPQNAAEAVVSLPFFKMDDGKRTILMQNCSVLPYRDTEWSDLSGKYQIPICVYYHCDMMYQSDANARESIQKVSDFQQKFGYNFMREDQLMLASAAAYNVKVDVATTDGGFIITPSALSTDFPLYDQEAQSACGLQIDFAEGLETAFAPDARVWKQTQNGFALGLDGPVTLREGATAASRHLLQVNLPAELTCDENGAEVSFHGEGMLQAVVSGSAETSDTSWTVDHYEDQTVFTKFGAKDTLHLTYSGG